MKRTLNSDSKKKGGVKWDEDNLEQNEILKQALNPIKINEPKTPYLSPMETDDEFDLDGAGMSPLSLEDEGPSTKRSSRLDGSNSSKTSSPGSVGANSVENSPGWRQRSPRFNEYFNEDESDHAEAGSDDSEQAEKRRKFMELRKQHYNMKQVLKHLKESTDEDEAGKEDEGNQEEQGNAEETGIKLLATSESEGNGGDGQHVGAPSLQQNGECEDQTDKGLQTAVS